MIKQVIVIRKDLNMRKGKMIAQGAHASLMAVTAVSNMFVIMQEWENTGQTKIVVGVNSEEELRLLHDKAIKCGLPSRLIVDKGKTEFGGKQTPTSMAIGPYYADIIDKVTGELELL